MDAPRKPATTIWVAFFSALVALTAFNYIANWKPDGLPPIPITQNGLRTLLGAGVLLVVGSWLALRLRPTKAHLWRYAIVGPLNMAIPQGLIMVALYRGAEEIDVGVAEATAPVIILVYMLAGRKFSWTATACVAGIIAGAWMFIDKKLSDHGMEPWWFLGASAVVTGLGLVVDDVMKWPQEQPLEPEWRTKVSKSLRKTLFSALLSGILSLAFVAAFGTLVNEGQVNVDTVTSISAAGWLKVAGLALVGTCASWFSLFLLIQQGQLALVPVVVVGIPVVTAVIDAFRGAGAARSGFQWSGVALLVAASAVLVYVQLVRKRN